MKTSANLYEKGYVITSRMIGDFFVSDQGPRSHTQTVARIIDFLVRFAGEHVSVSKKHGRNDSHSTKNSSLRSITIVVIPGIPEECD